MTTPITGGSVTFGRKVKPADYEGKDAIVMLSFNVEDGQDPKTVLDTVAEMAKSKALEMVGVRSVPAAGRTKADIEAETVAAASGKPALSKRNAKPPTATKSEGTSADAAAVVDDRQISSNPEARAESGSDDTFDIEDTAPTITDVQLTDEMTKHNAKIKNAPAIRELIRKYVPAPGQARDIPQDKRAAFIAEMKQLKPA